MPELAGPEDFARLLIAQKKEHDVRTANAPIRKHTPDPWDLHISEASLIRLIQLAWLASLRTDESRRVEARIFVSRFPAQFGMHCFAVEPPIELSSENKLARLASVAPVSDCAIDVVEKDGKLFVAGVSRDMTSNAAAARTLQQFIQASRGGWDLLILGPGHLRATTPSLSRYMDLSNGVISWPIELVDVPPVHGWISRIGNAVARDCASGLSQKAAGNLQRNAWKLVAGLLSSAVREIAAARHGGTLLVCDQVPDGLLVGGASSTGSWPLSNPLQRLAAASVLEVGGAEPTSVDKKVLGAWIEASDQLTAWSKMCAQLAQADGCVLLDADGRLKAFGLEIAVGARAAPMGQVRDALSGLPLDMSAFGTRHRSVARFCSASESAFGIVVSQDGGIRVFGGAPLSDVKLWSSIEASFRP